MARYSIRIKVALGRYGLGVWHCPGCNRASPHLTSTSDAAFSAHRHARRCEPLADLNRDITELPITPRALTALRDTARRLEWT